MKTPRTLLTIDWDAFIPEPLIADMSSDILSRALPWDRIDMVYAGSQKNLAPAGMGLVILSDRLMQQARQDIPAYLRYDLHAGQNSLYNTPPSFVVWMTCLTLRCRKNEACAGLPDDSLPVTGLHPRDPRQ